MASLLAHLKYSRAKRNRWWLCRLFVRAIRWASLKKNEYEFLYLFHEFPFIDVYYLLTMSIFSYYLLMQRFNVILTRAKCLLIIIGDPHTLCLDKNWKQFMKHCLDNGGFIQSNIPFRLWWLMTDDYNSDRQPIPCSSDANQNIAHDFCSVYT